MKRTNPIWWMPALLLACSPGPESSYGFHLPSGDADAGRATFVELGCVSCHTVEGVDLAPPGGGRALDVRLGGKVLRVRTYGELVTAVIHPSRDLSQRYAPEEVSREGESLMPSFNDQLTVGQLVDLVAFLQPQYVEYLPAEYEPYFP